jgi:predicted PolB exonuclease-like 3'-5' exonuclease
MPNKCYNTDCLVACESVAKMAQPRKKYVCDDEILAGLYNADRLFEVQSGCEVDIK